MKDWMEGGVVENDAEEARSERIWGEQHADLATPDEYSGYEPPNLFEYDEEVDGPVPPTDQERDLEEQRYRELI